MRLYDVRDAQRSLNTRCSSGAALDASDWLEERRGRRSAIVSIESQRVQVQDIEAIEMSQIETGAALIKPGIKPHPPPKLSNQSHPDRRIPLVDR